MTKPTDGTCLTQTETQFLILLGMDNAFLSTACMQHNAMMVIGYQVTDVLLTVRLKQGIVKQLMGSFRLLVKRVKLLSLNKIDATAETVMNLVKLAQKKQTKIIALHA